MEIVVLLLYVSQICLGCILEKWLTLTVEDTDPVLFVSEAQILNNVQCLSSCRMSNWW